MNEELKEVTCDCEHKSTRRSCLVSVLIILIMILLGCILYIERHNIHNFITDENPDEVLIEETDTSAVQCEETSIKDILEMRKQMREDRRVDSVFLTIPDVVLIDILMQHGTSLSIKDMIYIYESNTSTYNTVLSGARAQKYLDDSIQTHVISPAVNDSI